MLEPRLLLNGDPVQATIFEEQWPGNNLAQTAYPLNLNWGGPNEYLGPKLDATDQDFYFFQTLRPPESGDTATLSVLNTGNFPLVVTFEFLDQFGLRQPANDRVGFESGKVIVDLGELPSTIFLLGVHPNLSDPGNPFIGVMDYSVTLDVPPILPDSFDAVTPNNTIASASELGTIEGFQFAEFTIHDTQDRDFYQFELAAGARDEHYVAIDFQHFTTTDLGLALYQYDSVADELALLDISTGPSNRHEVSLANLPPSTSLPPNTSYYLEVFGDGGGTVTNPRYVLSSFAPLVARLDSFEPNDSFATPHDLGNVEGVLRLGETAMGTAGSGMLSIHSPNDLDVFRFSINQPGSENDFVRIDFDHSQGDLDLLLFSDSGSPFVLNASVGVSDTEQISLESLPTGAYYAVVLGSLGATNPSYGLTIQAGADPLRDQFDGNFGNDNRNRATSLGPVRGLRRLAAPDTLLSIHSGDEDWYEFELTEMARAGHFAAIGFDQSLGDLDFELYRGDSTRLAASNGVADNESINLAELAAGVYYLRVFGFNGATNPEYGLTINAPGPDRHDQVNPNNTPMTATNLRAIGGRFQEIGLSIDPSGDEDWFQFETGAVAATGNVVRIDFEHARGDLDLFLYDESGTGLPLASSQGVSNAEVIDLTHVDLPGGGNGPLPAGTYKVRVIGFDNATNPLYSLNIAAPSRGGLDRFDRSGDTNGERSQAVDLGALADNDGTPGGLVTIADHEDPLSIHPAGDEDWFEIPITGRETGIHFAVIEFDHTQGDLDLELYRNSESMPLRRSDGVANTHLIDLAGLDPADTYFLRIFGFVGDTGSATNPAYSLFVNLPEQVSGDWAEGAGNNNERGEATDLGVFSRVLRRENLSIHDENDEDWFRFETQGVGESSHAVTIAFDHFAGDLQLQLYDQSGKLLRQSSTVNDSETVSLDGLPKATYFVRIVGRDSGGSVASNPSYRLTIDPPPGPGGDYAESNDTPGSAFDLREVRGPITFDPLSIHLSNNDDWFRFTTTTDAVDGNEIAISFDSRLGDLDLFLYDATGIQLIGESRTAQDVERIELNDLNLSAEGAGPLPAGTYLVRVSGHRGNTHPRYLLSIDAPNDELPPDRAEENDRFDMATNLQQIRGTQQIGGLSIDEPTDEDWFRFETLGPGVEGHQVSIVFDHGQGDLELALFSSDGTTMLDQSTGVSNQEVVTLEGRAAGTYFVRVRGEAGVTQPAYTLAVTAPARLARDYAERADGNDLPEDAYDLRTIKESLALGGLSIDVEDDQDWFKFQLPHSTSAGQFARIDFLNAEGNLKLELFREDLTLVASSNGSSNFEELPLVDDSGNRLVAGNYLLRVTAVDGDTNPYYSLTITASPIVQRDRYEDNDTLAAAFDLRDLSALSKTSQLETRFFGSFGFGGFPSFGGFGFGGGFSFPGFGGVPNFGGGFGGFPGFGGGFGGGGLGGILNGSFQSLDIGIGSVDSFFGGGFGLDVPFGPGLGVGGLISMELNFTNQFNNWAWQGAMDLARLIPDVPGAVQALGFGGVHLSNSINQGNQAFYGYLANLQNNSTVQLNAIDRFNLGAIRQQGPFLDQFGNQRILDLNSVNTLLGAGLISLKPFGRGSAQSTATVDNLSIEAGDADYFRFELTQPGLEGQFVGIGFDHDLGDLTLSLLDWSGNPSEPPDMLESSNGQGNAEQISLANLPIGAYYVRITGVDGATSNPSYSLVINTRADGQQVGDLTEDNDTEETAYDLRTVEGVRTLRGLSIHEPGDEDWFQFEIAATSSSPNEFVRIDFDHDQGDLDLELYRQGQPTSFAASTGTDDFEEIPLVNENGQPLAAGEVILLRVMGYGGATNPSYDLTVNAPLLEVRPDRFEPNNLLSRAVALNDLSSVTHLGGPTIHANDQDFYKFTIPAGLTAGESHSIGIEFDMERGALQLALLDSLGTVIRTPTTHGGNRIIPLDGLVAGQYLVRVQGESDVVQNRYILHVDAPLESSRPVDDWTVMIYVTASDLAEFAFKDINEMERAAATLPESVNIAVLYDQSALAQRFATGGGTQAAWGETGRAVIRPDTNPDLIATPFDLSLGEQNTGDPGSLVDFVRWAQDAAPAEHYALIMWNHGQGVEGFNFDNADGGSADRITAAEMAAALEDLATSSSFRPDLMAFDSCNLAMIELADRFRSFTDVIVASQENIAGAGFDYANILSPLVDRPELISPELLASGLIESFENQYRGNALGADTLSAIRTSAISRLVDSLQGFTAAALAPAVTATHIDVLRDARDSATSFVGHPEFRDLGQFMSYVGEATSLPNSIRDAARQVADSLETTVVAKTSDQRQTTGLSILFPAYRESPNMDYSTQFSNFLTVSGWLEFLNEFSTGPTSRPASLNPDFAEANEFAPRAYDLHALVGQGHEFRNLSLHRQGDVDWFRFSTVATGTAADQIEVTRDAAGGNWQLTLHNLSGAELDSASGAGVSLNVSLSGRAAGTYLVRVHAGGEMIVARYAIAVDAPSMNLDDDWSGQNRTAAKAFDLGVVSRDTLLSGLTVAPEEEDWFAFVTPRNVAFGASQGMIRIVSSTETEFTINLATAQGTIATKTGTGLVELAFDTGTAIPYRLGVQSDASATYSIEFTTTVENSFDFGDAPTADQSGFAADYPTQLPGGARHAFGAALFLGKTVDQETDGQPTIGADGDASDEDGVQQVTSLVTTTIQNTKASFLVEASAEGKLDGWIDFNRDGDWLDEGEQLFAASINVSVGLNPISVTVPAGASVGDTFARFRLSSVGGLSPGGAADDGEVEDYLVTVLDGDPGTIATLDLAVGEVEVVADGNQVVVQQPGIELFRAPGSALAGGTFLGTVGGDSVLLGNVDTAITVPIPLNYDGGSGVDALRLIARDQTLDLTDRARNQLVNLEVIDIVGDGANQMTLDLQSVLDLTDAGNRLLVLHDEDDTVQYLGTWAVLEPKFVDDTFVHVLHQGAAEVLIRNTLPWTNPYNRLDSNRDGSVSPIDVLVDFNTLNDFGSRLLATPTPGSLPPFYHDSSEDGFVSPIDPLIKINFLNDSNSSISEAESDAPKTGRLLRGAAGVFADRSANWGHPSTRSGTISRNSLDDLTASVHEFGRATSGPLASPRSRDEAFRAYDGLEEDLIELLSNELLAHRAEI